MEHRTADQGGRREIGVGTRQHFFTQPGHLRQVLGDVHDVLAHALEDAFDGDGHAFFDLLLRGFNVPLNIFILSRLRLVEVSDAVCQNVFRLTLSFGRLAAHVSRSRFYRFGFGLINQITTCLHRMLHSIGKTVEELFSTVLRIVAAVLNVGDEFTTVVIRPLKDSTNHGIRPRDVPLIIRAGAIHIFGHVVRDLENGGDFGEIGVRRAVGINAVVPRTGNAFTVVFRRQGVVTDLYVFAAVVLHVVDVTGTGSPRHTLRTLAADKGASLFNVLFAGIQFAPGVFTRTDRFIHGLTGVVVADHSFPTTHVTLVEREIGFHLHLLTELINAGFVDTLRRLLKILTAYLCPANQSASLGVNLFRHTRTSHFAFGYTVRQPSQSLNTSRVCPFFRFVLNLGRIVVNTHRSEGFACPAHSVTQIETNDLILFEALKPRCQINRS